VVKRKAFIWISVPATRFALVIRIGFIEKAGGGVNIDPLKSSIDKFNKKRKRDTNIMCGAGKGRSIMTFYKMFPDTTSTFSKTEMEKFIKMGCKLVGKEKIQIYPLREITEKYIGRKKVDFFTLDVEGIDMEVLRSNNWNEFRPKVICVENSFEAESYLASKNYKKVGQTRINSIYLLSKTEKRP